MISRVYFRNETSQSMQMMSCVHTPRFYISQYFDSVYFFCAYHIFLQGSKMASQIRAAAYVECSSRTNNASVQEVFEIASLAAIGKLNLQKSYIDLPSAVKKLPLQQSFRRKKRSTSVLRPVRVKATVVERESRGCIVM